jgi:hypothetical protein
LTGALGSGQLVELQLGVLAVTDGPDGDVWIYDGFEGTWRAAGSPFLQPDRLVVANGTTLVALDNGDGTRPARVSALYSAGWSEPLELPTGSTEMSMTSLYSNTVLVVDDAHATAFVVQTGPGEVREVASPAPMGRTLTTIIYAASVLRVDADDPSRVQIFDPEGEGWEDLPGIPGMTHVDAVHGNQAIGRYEGEPNVRIRSFSPGQGALESATLGLPAGALAWPGQDDETRGDVLFVGDELYRREDEKWYRSVPPPARGPGDAAPLTTLEA